MSMCGNTRSTPNGPVALTASLFIWVAALLTGLFILADWGVGKIAEGDFKAKYAIESNAVRTEQRIQDLRKSMRLHAQSKPQWT